MDYEKLKGVYGRLLGLTESLPERNSNFGANIADDYNDIVKELSEITGDNLACYVIPREAYWRDGSYVNGYYSTKIKQIVSYLRYKHNLDENILEIGSLINAIENQGLKDRCLDLLTAK